MEISLPSLGSSQTLPLPHLRTLAASRFWSFNETIFDFVKLRTKEKWTVVGRGGFYTSEINALGFFEMGLETVFGPMGLLVLRIKTNCTSSQF